MISLRSAGTFRKSSLQLVLTVVFLAMPSARAASKPSACRHLAKTTTFRNCSAAVTYEVKVSLRPKRLLFHVRFHNEGPNAVFFLADHPPVIAQNVEEASISVALGEPALQSSELPRMMRVAPDATVERNVDVPISLELTQVKFIYFTLFFATDDPGFFEHLAKDCARNERYWLTEHYHDQARYTDLVRSDTVEFPLLGHLAEGIKTHRAEKGK